MDFRSQAEERPASDSGRGRSRTVTFRVSAREFEAMSRASRSSGARTLSAFARSAVNEQVRAMQSPAVTLTGDLATLSRTLVEVDLALQEASKRIRRVLGPGDSQHLEAS